MGFLKGNWAIHGRTDLEVGNCGIFYETKLKEFEEDKYLFPILPRQLLSSNIVLVAGDWEIGSIIVYKGSFPICERNVKG